MIHQYLVYTFATAVGATYVSVSLIQFFDRHNDSLENLDRS
jgi:hypothetical protein